MIDYYRHLVYIDFLNKIDTYLLNKMGFKLQLYFRYYKKKVN
jgi:hypothetical protein